MIINDHLMVPKRSSQKVFAKRSSQQGLRKKVFPKKAPKGWAMDRDRAPPEGPPKIMKNHDFSMIFMIFNDFSLIFIDFH